MDRITPTEAITLLDSPINLAAKMEKLDDLSELDINQALESIQEPCPLPYSEYIELTSDPDTFTSWISPFLSDHSCIRPAIALSIPYLDRTGPQPTVDETGDEYPQPHLFHNDELTRFPEPRPFINYELVQNLYGIAFDFGYLDRNATGRFAYLQQGRDRYYSVHADLQKACQALQSVVVAAEMMGNEEGHITDKMEAIEKLDDKEVMEAQARTEPHGHTSETTNANTKSSLPSDYPASPLHPILPPTLGTTAIMPPALIYEGSALIGEYAVLDDQLFANHSFRNRNCYEMNFYQWKLEKLMKRRDRVSKNLSALKQRFCENELPLLRKVGKWYCRRAEEKERLSRETFMAVEKDVEMEEVERYGDENFMDEQMGVTEVWNKDEQVFMDADMAAAQLDENVDASSRIQEEIHDTGVGVSESRVEDVL
ncbi:hypothetical protein MMC18_002421 [Xylographa bjoerkii]|nr:hypothetical protein [Xylographa bjoerkii]